MATFLRSYGLNRGFLFSFPGWAVRSSLVFRGALRRRMAGVSACGFSRPTPRVTKQRRKTASTIVPDGVGTIPKSFRTSYGGPPPGTLGNLRVARWRPRRRGFISATPARFPPGRFPFAVFRNPGYAPGRALCALKEQSSSPGHSGRGEHFGRSGFSGFEAGRTFKVTYDRFRDA